MSRSVMAIVLAMLVMVVSVAGMVVTMGDCITQEAPASGGGASIVVAGHFVPEDTAVWGNTTSSVMHFEVVNVWSADTWSQVMW